MKFGTFVVSNMPISILMLKNVFMKYLPIVTNTQNLLKFGTIDISIMVISVLVSKTVFIKYLLPVRPKLVPKLKMLRIYSNWHI